MIYTRQLGYQVLFPLVLSCTPPSEVKDSDSSSDSGDLCNYEDPVRSSTGWTEDIKDGVSPEDLFGWAIGTFETELFWDDATSTNLSITTSPGDATLITYGPADECAGPSLELVVSTTVASADARLALSYEGAWLAEETSDVGRLGSVSLDYALSVDTMGIAPLAEGSSVYLNLRIDDDDGLYVSMVERWNLNAHTERICVRAAMSVEALRCEDSIEDTGASVD